MKEEINYIDIYTKDLNFESNYIPLISFYNPQQKSTIENYIFTKADIFFHKIIKIEVDVRKSCINYPKIITEKDFKSVPIRYFYDNIFSDLGKRKDDNKLDFTPKWGITFDEKCAPIEVSYLSPGFKYKRNFKPFCYPHHKYKWKYRYGTIDINKKPVFYYIYFTLQELLDEIKKIP